MVVNDKICWYLFIFHALMTHIHSFFHIFHGDAVHLQGFEIVRNLNQFFWYTSWRQSMCNRTHTVQTCVAQVPTVQYWSWQLLVFEQEKEWMRWGDKSVGREETTSVRGEGIAQMVSMQTSYKKPYRGWAGESHRESGAIEGMSWCQQIILQRQWWVLWTDDKSFKAGVTED